MPRTKASISYDILNRTKLFSMNSFSFNFGYNWKESARKEHELIPFTVTYVNPINVTQEYLDSAKGNSTLLRAVEKQLILGSNYSYTYNSLLGNMPANGFYFNGMLDLSGNVAGLLTSANAKKGDTVKIGEVPFSQYTKVDLDFRWYRRVGGGKTIWANRIITGIGIPYGNSTVLPYIKQFFSGGNNSIRAFRSRSVGPGTFLDTNATTFYDQSGDIRLELNSELRIPLSGIIHGAVFIDAGNIWLFNEDTTKPGGKFSGDFLNQLAVGAGVGLRFDFNFLVLRLDLATPLRKPWLQDKRWVLNQFNLKNRDWRRENLVFNLAIGYPF
jgi:outer membrane protein assembly factor BamA